uniref:Uncharacterized protein n=1 Tax=Cucumis melo TaxID=3656 RepID=A0A9I9CD25_CUCME
MKEEGDTGGGAETDTKMEGERRLRRRADETTMKVEGARAVARRRGEETEGRRKNRGGG